MPYRKGWNSHTELVWVHDKWREYCELFGTSPERTELLNAAASRFFGSLDEILWENVLLHIARLTDPFRPGRGSSLTVRQLPQLISNKQLRSKIDGLIARALEAAKFARDWRNRRIAHTDRSLALDPTAARLAEASRLKVNEALRALDTVMQSIHQHYFDVTLSYDIVGGPGDALDLLRVLKDGVSAS